MIDEPTCSARNCKHFLGVLVDDGVPEKNERPYCLAFPKGIPARIAYGEDVHSAPVKGQGNDIVFEESDDA